ncbi:MAG TPA: DUF2147 domain-containing protein [Bryobacteraceae bacterium]|nr:DUF2147 domain-containing protein [Bryobacteraceae bacterium]
MAAGPSPVGLWKTVDDKTHKARGVIRLYEQNGEIFGRIETSFDPKEAADICDLCEGERKNKPIIGLVVLRHMKNDGGVWDGGDILDPETGSVYRCRMKLEDNGTRLVVRGFVGVSLFGRSQTWFREAQ